MGGRMLRPEARPLDLEELSLSQLETLDRVVSSMKEAHDQLHSSERQESAPKLDPKRSSRLYFVSGEPGIGKTTIYTTLRKLLAEERGTQNRGGDKLDAFRHEMDKRKKLKTDIRDNLLSLAGGVRWLEPLDLEPLSGSTNFLAAVLVRIERALEPSRAPKGRASTGGLLDRSPETRDAMAELNSFQNDLAMSWDGNLQERATHVEPDTYAAEVLRAERARLSVNQRLQGILSKLVPLGEEQRRKPPLFLLVVDDLYLNPASSIELLRLLRMISSPQLFVLLLGDYDLLEYLFYQQTLGDYIKLAGDAALNAFGDDFTEELKSRAWALAAGSLRKLLPPKQQTDLSTLWVDEALGFRALDAREKEEPVLLKDLLGQLRIGQGIFAATVEELITASWQTRQGETKPDWGRHIYSGALLLEMPPRHATDLWMTLADKDKPLPIKDTVELLGDEFRSALNEQNRVDGPQKKKLELAVTRGNAQSIFEDYKLHTKLLSIRTDKIDISEKKISDVRGSIHDTTTIYAPARIEWSMQLSKNVDKNVDKELDLPPRLLGWLVVLHDVLVLSRPQNVLGGSLVSSNEKVSSNENLRWVRFSWKENKSGDNESRNSESLYWPAPEWSTFLEFDLLKWAWNNLVDESDGRPIHWEVRAFRWFDAICSILTENKDKKLVHFADPSARPEESLWKGLVERIRNLACSAAGKASKTTRYWIVDVGIVVALRLGISEDVAKCFEEDQVLNDFWRSDTEIKEMRNNAPGKRGWHAYAAKYFPEAWPPVPSPQEG